MKLVNKTFFLVHGFVRFSLLFPCVNENGNWVEVLILSKILFHHSSHIAESNCTLFEFSLSDLNDLKITHIFLNQILENNFIIPGIFKKSRMMQSVFYVKFFLIWPASNPVRVSTHFELKFDAHKAGLDFFIIFVALYYKIFVLYICCRVCFK